MTMVNIPVSKPDLSGNEEKYVLEAIRSTWISSTGSFLSRAAQDFAAACGVKECALVSSGTVALHLAMLAMGVRPGDEVLVPSLTYIATANAVRYVGAEPIFVDVDSTTWCIDPVALERSITRRTRGIIAVHLYGHPADMDVINRIAGVHGLWVVEDAAEAHFAKYKGRPTGGLATIGVFSFYGNKVITSGEGGALTYNDSNLGLRIRTLRGQGMDPDRRYYFPVTGYNFRLTNLAAAVLCAQLERQHSMIEHRRRIYAGYIAGLNGTPGIKFQPAAPWADVCPWLFPITVNAAEFGLARDALAQRLAAKGIETRPFFIPLHELPPFREQSRARGEILPVTTQLASTGLSLPTYPEMSDADVRQVVEAIVGVAAGV